MPPLVMVLALLAAAVVMFAIDRPRMDVVALIMIVLLPFTGVVTVPEALAGFSDPNIVLIAAFFVIGEALVRTGVAQRLGDWLTLRAGASEPRLIVLLMLVVATVGSVMSSTGVVAIFIPIVLRAARVSGIPAGRLMMPLSMAALISGMMTLVATTPNLVVHAELIRQGHPGLGFFTFTPFGVPILLLAILYMLVARRFLAAGPAPAASDRAGLRDWVVEYELAGRAHRLRLLPDSRLVGRRLDALDLRSGAGLNIVAIERDRRFSRKIVSPRADTVLKAGDILLVDRRMADAEFEQFAREQRLALEPAAGGWFTNTSQDIGMAELLVPPSSRLIGHSAIDAHFRTSHDLSVIGLKRGSHPVPGCVIDKPLHAGDTLLAIGPWRAIRRLADERRDLLLLDLPAESDEAVPALHRAPRALAVLALVVGLMASGVVPNVQAALLGCLLLGLFRCIDIGGAYRAIHWQSLILIVGMLPFSLALQRTGGVEIAARTLLDLCNGGSPRLLLAVIFAATATLSLFISNTATAVLMAPVALAIAADLGVSPRPFALTVALAASAAFMTPVSSPVNTLVVGPGNYRFGDFVRIGAPFALICMIACVLLVPVLLPLEAAAPEDAPRRSADRGHHVPQETLEFGRQTAPADLLVDLRAEGVHALRRGGVVGQVDDAVERDVRVAGEVAKELGDRDDEGIAGGGGGGVEQHADLRGIEGQPALHLGGGGGPKARLLLQGREAVRVDHEQFETVGLPGEHRGHRRLPPPHADLPEHGGCGERRQRQRLGRLVVVAGDHQRRGRRQHDVHLAGPFPLPDQRLARSERHAPAFEAARGIGVGVDGMQQDGPDEAVGGEIARGEAVGVEERGDVGPLPDRPAGRLAGGGVEHRRIPREPPGPGLPLRLEVVGNLAPRKQQLAGHGVEMPRDMAPDGGA
jgi:di/tricarboxylate transporter